MKISVIFNIILAVIIAVICFAKHVTIVNTLPSETPAVAPVEATGDSSWLWTDFSHPDTLVFFDNWSTKDNQVGFRAVTAWHTNGMVATVVYSESHGLIRTDGVKLIGEVFVHYSPRGYEIAKTYKNITYKEFLDGIKPPDRGFWLCELNGAYSKNPSACPEPSPENHVYNHQVKEK